MTAPLSSPSLMTS